VAWSLTHASSVCKPFGPDACICRWISDIEAYTPDSKVDYPIISDPNRDIATLCVTRPFGCSCIECPFMSSICGYACSQ